MFIILLPPSHRQSVDISSQSPRYIFHRYQHPSGAEDLHQSAEAGCWLLQRSDALAAVQFSALMDPHVMCEQQNKKRADLPLPRRAAAIGAHVCCALPPPIKPVAEKNIPQNEAFLTNRDEVMKTFSLNSRDPLQITISGCMYGAVAVDDSFRHQSGLGFGSTGHCAPGKRGRSYRDESPTLLICVQPGIRVARFYLPILVGLLNKIR